MMEKYGIGTSGREFVTIDDDADTENSVKKRKNISICGLGNRDLSFSSKKEKENEIEVHKTYLQKIKRLRRTKTVLHKKISDLFKHVDLSFVKPYIVEEFKKEDEHLTEELFQIVNVDEMCSISLILLSVLNGLAYYEIKQNIKNEQSEIQNQLINITLIICSVSCFLFIILLIPKYYHYFILYKCAQYSFDFDKFHNSNLIFYAFLEFILAIIHPNLLFKNIYFTTKKSWNLVEITYNLNDILLIIHLCRIFYIFKLIIMFSYHYGARADRINKMIGRKLSMFFSFRSLLISQTGFILILITIILVLVLAYMLRIIEGPVGLINKKVDYSHILDCVWNILVTMTTVGYGDYYPKSVIGRSICFIIAFSGSFIVGMIVNFLEKLTFLNYKEKISLEFIQRLKCKDEVNNASLKYVVCFVNYRLYKNKLLRKVIKLNSKSKETLIKLAKKKVAAHLYYKHQLHKFHIKYTMENEASILKIKIDNALEVSKKNTEKIAILNEKIKKFMNNVKKFQRYKNISKYK